MRWTFLLLLIIVFCTLQVDGGRSRGGGRSRKSRKKKAKAKDAKRKENQKDRKKKERDDNPPGEQQPQEVAPSSNGEAAAEVMKEFDETQEGMKENQAVQETYETGSELQHANDVQGQSLAMLEAKKEEKKLKMEQHCDENPQRARLRRSLSPEGDAGTSETDRLSHSLFKQGGNCRGDYEPFYRYQNIKHACFE